ALSSVLSSPEVAREYTARRRSNQRSGWLARSSHTQIRRRPTKVAHNQTWVCRSRKTSGGSDSAHEIPSGVVVSKAHACPSQCSIPTHCLSQKWKAAAATSTQRHAAATTPIVNEYAPCQAQATPAPPPASKI